MVTENYKVRVQVEGANQLKQLNANTIAITSSLGGLGTAAKIATGALAAIGGTRLAGSFLATARQLETLETRLGFLFGTAEEGAKAFEELRDFAGQVPFSLEEIAQAAGVLAVVSDDAEQLRENLELTGNVAAVAGLDFVTAGEQIQRSLSAGISSAELLRERGVREILGFKAGVTVTAEETAEALNRVFGPGGRFGDAALALADTFDGLVSMVSDKMFTFRGLVMDAGPFDMLKAIVKTTDDALAENFGSIEQAAAKIGEGIVKSAETALVGSGFILDAVTPIFEVFRQSFNNIVAATNGLPGPIKAVGVVGFLFMGVKGKLIVSTIGFVLDYVIAAYAALGDGLAKLKRAAASVQEFLGFDEAAKKLRVNANEIEQSMEDLRKKFQIGEHQFEDTEDATMSFIEKLESGEIVGGKYTEMMLNLVHKLRETQEELNQTKQEVEKLEGAMGDGEKTTKAATITMDNFKKKFEETFKEADEKFDPVQDGVDLMIKSFENFKRGVGDAFADAIMGAKSFAESIRDVGRAILRQLISGIIQIGLEIFVFDVLREKLKGIKKEQDNLNAALGIELGLRTALAFFTGGGSLFAGFFADGGKIPAGKFGVAGEEGPELISGPATVTPMTPEMTSSAQGDVNINFNISTVDARGFDELLMSRRGIISGIINEGLNRQGRMAIV